MGTARCHTRRLESGAAVLPAQPASPSRSPSFVGGGSNCATSCGRCRRPSSVRPVAGADVRIDQDVPEPLGPASGFLCDELVPLLAGKGQEDFVFPGPEGGPLRHGNFCARHFKPAVGHADLPETVRFHDLRHSFAGFLIAGGAHPRAIMERMGHSSITVTLNTYGHILPGLEEQLTDAFDTRGRGARTAAGSGGSRVGHAAPVAMGEIASEQPLLLRPRQDSNLRRTV